MNALSASIAAPIAEPPEQHVSGPLRLRNSLRFAPYFRDDRRIGWCRVSIEQPIWIDGTRRAWTRMVVTDGGRAPRHGARFHLVATDWWDFHRQPLRAVALPARGGRRWLIEGDFDKSVLGPGRHDLFVECVDGPNVRWVAQLHHDLVAPLADNEVPVWVRAGHGLPRYRLALVGARGSVQE